MKTIAQTLSQSTRMLRRTMTRAMAVIFLAASSVALAQADDSLANLSSGVVADEWSGSGTVSSGGIRLRLNNGRLQSAVTTNMRVERPLPVKTYLRAITDAHGFFVAVGGGYCNVPGVIITSNDGVNWVRRNP